MTEPASFIVDPADVPKLRGAVSKLAGVGYSETSVRERLGLEDFADLQWLSLPMFRSERLAGRDPLALAIDLFLLQGDSSNEQTRAIVRSVRTRRAHPSRAARNR